MQSLSNSNNNKLVHLYNICHKNKQSPSGLNIARTACVYQTSESGLSPKEAKDILWFLSSD